jgi:hypothetical protein
MYIGLGFSILGMFLAIRYVRGLRLEITPEGISFSSLFRGTRFVGFDEISTVVLVSPFRFYLRVDPESYPRVVLIITPTPATGKRKIRIPLTFIDAEAENEIVSLLKPSIWGEG